MATQRIAACFAVLKSLSPHSLADSPITIATWNVAQIDRDLDDLDIDGFLNEVDFDILLVDEIKTQNDLDSLKAAMDREDFFTAISSFENGSGNLEVGIISRFPISNVVEFDRSPDNFGSSIDERRLEPVDRRGIADAGVGGGFLVAKIPVLDMFVIDSHFKSSRGRNGPSDYTNAQKRELVAAAVATHMLELQEDHPGCTVLFGGNVNVGITDTEKNGTDLEEDLTDGYDETHALLGGGLIDDLTMRSLAKDVSGTYVGDDDISDFPGTGAIDVLYIIGPMSDQFQEAKAATTRYGSDHLAVFASTGGAPDDDEDDPDPVAADTVEIVNALPNPDGDDTRREQIVIENQAAEPVNISGWFMHDRAGNEYKFGTGVTLQPGENAIVLAEHTMPLNNNGDEIMLFDSGGVQHGPTFRYSGSDVRSGQLVR